MLKDYKNKQLINYNNKTMPEKNKEKKVVNFFDPVANAYREIPVELAKKYIEHLEELKKQLNINKK